MKHIDIALVSVHSPLLCGIYEDNILVESMQSDELLLVGLPHIFESLLPTQKQDSHYKDTRIRAIYYASGPGSFSALKLTHIFLHTLQYLYDIKLFATSSFYFTHSAYIKAFGTSYFHRDAENNIIRKVRKKGHFFYLIFLIKVHLVFLPNHFIFYLQYKGFMKDISILQVMMFERVEQGFKLFIMLLISLFVSTKILNLFIT